MTAALVGIGFVALLVGGWLAIRRLERAADDRLHGLVTSITAQIEMARADVRTGQFQTHTLIGEHLRAVASSLDSGLTAHGQSLASAVADMHAHASQAEARFAGALSKLVDVSVRTNPQMSAIVREARDMRETAICDGCHDTVRVWHTYADGRTVCANCR